MVGRGDGNGATTAILIGVWATFALDVFSTLNSSPQTTELFAGDREETLLHWVLIGDAFAIGGGLAGTLYAKEPWPLFSALAITIMMHLLYKHAVKRGTGKAAPGKGTQQGNW